MSKVLVGYATRYGSTREVAEAITDVLREGGLDVDLRQLREVKSLAEYQAVVIGAAFYIFKWHKDALKFLDRFQKPLAEMPVALFALGPTEEPKDEKAAAEVNAQMDRLQSQHAWLKPVAQKLFGGKMDPATMTFPWNIFMKAMPVSDMRDWQAIRAWASEVRDHLIALQPG